MKKIIILLILSVMPSWAIAQPEENSPEELMLFKEIEGPHRFTTKDFHQKTEWKVEEKQVIQDTTPLKGEKFSTIDWEGQDPNQWLDIDRWLADRAAKDSVPDWKIRIRLNTHKELIGKVLKCSGICQSFRGSKPIQIRHLSQIKEGDEIQTGKDSSIWIFLIDGTLVRISPESSVSFNEINLAKNQAMYVVRLNQGHFYWHHRVNEVVPQNLSPQTDQVSLPLLVREANIDFFERQIYQKQDELQRFLSLSEGSSKATEKLFEKMNEYKKAHQEKMNGLNNRVFVVAPNFSLDVVNTSFDAFYLPNDKGHFKRRDDIVINDKQEKQFKLHLRGYANDTIQDISTTQWTVVDAEGKSFSEEAESSPHLSIVELVTKRVASLELAAEIWTEKYTLPVIDSFSDESKLAVDFGYRLWGEDIGTRLAFLYEYTRRVETTNLKSLDRLVKDLTMKGDFRPLLIDEKFYVKALETYVKSIKHQFNQKAQQRRLMNDLQFYAWILKNDK
ncbi:MAG: hypothetical protein ACOVP4_03180 [Bacteriovoracaceae bacterium]